MERRYPSHWIRDGYYPTLYSNGGRMNNAPYSKDLINRHPSPGYFYSEDPRVVRPYENRTERTPRLKASPPVDMIKVEEGDLIPAYTWKKRQLEYKGRHTPEDRVYSSQDISEVPPWPAARLDAYNTNYHAYRDRIHGMDNNYDNNYNHNNGKDNNNNDDSNKVSNINHVYNIKEKIAKKNIEKRNEHFPDGIKVEKEDDCKSSSCCQNSKSSNAQMLERLSKGLREEIVWPSHDLIVEGSKRNEIDMSRDIDALNIREKSASPPPVLIQSPSPPPSMVRVKVEDEESSCGEECSTDTPIQVDFIKNEDGEIVPSYEHHPNHVSSPPLKLNDTLNYPRNNQVCIIKPNLPPPPPLRKIVKDNLRDVEVAHHSSDINSSMNSIIEKGSKSIAATQNIQFTQEAFISTTSPDLPLKEKLTITMIPERIVKDAVPSRSSFQNCKYCFCKFVPDPSVNIFVDRKRQHIFICNKCRETRENHLHPITLEEQEEEEEQLQEEEQQQQKQGHSPPQGQLHYKCDVCDKLFSQKSNLQTHKRIHTGEKPYECGVCNKMFRDKSALIKHSQTHTFEKPYACFICGKSFSQKSNLRTHERIHTGERPFKCAICSKSFTDNSALIKHRRIHTGEKPYSCVKCDKRFCSLNYLNHHLKTHENEKTVSCTLCNKRFYSLKHLQIHFKIHTTEKLFQCKVCHKQFQTNNYLKIHERIHTGEKPFRCQICVKKFRDNSALKRHLKTHTGEKPHKCNICDRVFGQKSHLQAHLRTHTGEKPYKCHLCSKTFTQDSNLKSHQRVHMFSIKMENDSEMRKMLLHNI